MFTTDRDLLTLEPNLFNDVLWLGQRLVDVPCTISGTTLTVSGIDLAALGIGPGMVAVVDGAGLEVIERLTTTTLKISRPRAALDEAATPPLPGTGRPLTIATFRPQIAIVHAQVLRMLGLESAGSTIAGAITESQVTNPRDLWLFEALLALHLIYSAAAALTSEGSALAARAESFRRRAAFERPRAAALIDLNNDQAPDATRYPNIVQFERV